jgi:hypothetical protein
MFEVIRFLGFTAVNGTIDQKMRLTKDLETSASVTVPFTAGKPTNLQHYMDRGDSLKSQL